MQDDLIAQRVAVLEAQYDALRAELHAANEKLDTLLRITAMGRGALMALMKVGGVFAVFAGAAAWLWDHFR